jgi:hypothetical protein
MKRRLTFKQLLPALIGALVALFYALYRLFFHPALTPEIIRITAASYPNTDDLVLKDIGGGSATTFHVKAGKKIQWVAPASVIKEITNIYMKPGTYVDVFCEHPHPTGTFLIWQGTVGLGEGGKTEDYNIDWTDLEGNPHIYDPKIQVML